MIERQDRSTRLHSAHNPGHDAALSLLQAAGGLQQQLAAVCTRFGITQDQYAVLQILRGVHPGGYARHEIADRLTDRAPDVTRLLDRLERSGLVERRRHAEDRRLSLARITRMGLVLLEQMDEPLAAVRDSLLGPLSPDDRSELHRLCRLLTPS